MSSGLNLKSDSRLDLIRDGVFDFGSTEWPCVMPQAARNKNQHLSQRWSWLRLYLTKRHLGRALIVLRTDFTQHRLIDQLCRTALPPVYRVLVAKGRVLRDMNPLCSMPWGKLKLLQPWVAFHLVDGWNNRRIPQKPFHLCFAKVWNADCFDFAGFQELFHRFVCLAVVRIVR